MHFKIEDQENIKLPELVTYLGNFIQTQENLYRDMATVDQKILGQKDRTQLQKVIDNTIIFLLKEKIKEAGIVVPQITLHSNHNEYPEILTTFRDSRCGVNIDKLISENESANKMI